MSEASSLTERFLDQHLFVLVFNQQQQLLLSRSNSTALWRPALFSNIDSEQSLDAKAEELLAQAFSEGGKAVSVHSSDLAEPDELLMRVFLHRKSDPFSKEVSLNHKWIDIGSLIEETREQPNHFEPWWPALLEALTPYLYRIAYFDQKNIAQPFRPRKNYQLDLYSSLYQSQICEAIQEVKRVKEQNATSPALLDFGAVQYNITSHFGFCLGVFVAVNTAYRAIAENPGKRIFMLSELIHNPFVNEDLKSRGLRYLQNVHGIPYNNADDIPYWDTLIADDIVIIPAFGATNEVKSKLVAKNISITSYDATCTLVERVWKAGKAAGQAGYTVVIHGKSEHEETKASFSYCKDYAPCIVVRNMEEAQQLAQMIKSESLEEKEQFYETFKADSYGNPRYTSGFDVTKHLDKIAVINQTTLLRNETLSIAAFLEETLLQKYGPDLLPEHFKLQKKGSGNTLCYATQVNQDALELALQQPITVAIVIGGKNSSNTSQLFKLCEQKLGPMAFYIQSEKEIESLNRIVHYDFREKLEDKAMKVRDFIGDHKRPTILITGGASCPDGLIQQVITKINSFFPSHKLRSVETVIEDLQLES